MPQAEISFTSPLPVTIANAAEQSGPPFTVGSIWRVEPNGPQFKILEVKGEWLHVATMGYSPTSGGEENVFRNLPESWIYPKAFPSGVWTLATPQP